MKFPFKRKVNKSSAISLRSDDILPFYSHEDYLRLLNQEGFILLKNIEDLEAMKSTAIHTFAKDTSYEKTTNGGMGSYSSASGYNYKKYAVLNDIVFPEGYIWIPGNIFYGTFDCAFKRIKGIFLSFVQNYNGLFSRLSGPESKIMNVLISGKMVCDKGYNGILVGENNNQASVRINSGIMNCGISGIIFAEGNDAGAIGYMTNSASYYRNCYSSVIVVGNGVGLGGFIGNHFDGRNCGKSYSIGLTLGSTRSGGLIGRHREASWYKNESSYFNKETSGREGHGTNKGIAKSTAEMMRQSTYGRTYSGKCEILCPYKITIEGAGLVAVNGEYVFTGSMVNGYPSWAKGNFILRRETNGHWSIYYSTIRYRSITADSEEPWGIIYETIYVPHQYDPPPTVIADMNYWYLKRLTGDTFASNGTYFKDCEFKINGITRIIDRYISTSALVIYHPEGVYQNGLDYFVNDLWDFDNLWKIDEGKSYPYFKWEKMRAEHRPPPLKAMVVKSSRTSVYVLWEMPKDADGNWINSHEGISVSGYNIYRLDKTQKNIMLLAEDHQTSSLFDDNIPPGEYVYFIKAKYTGMEGESGNSNPVHVNINVCPSLGAKNAEIYQYQNQYYMTWENADKEPPDGFEVYYSTDNRNSWTKINQTLITETKFYFPLSFLYEFKENTKFKIISIYNSLFLKYIESEEIVNIHKKHIPSSILSGIDEDEIRISWDRIGNGKNIIVKNNEIIEG